MMAPQQKSFNRLLLPDRDRDKVPDHFDCQPFNRKRQDSRKRNKICKRCKKEKEIVDLGVCDDCYADEYVIWEDAMTNNLPYRW